LTFSHRPRARAQHVHRRPKGTAALQTAHERRKFSDTKVIWPIPVLGLESDGFNPLRHLNPWSPDFLGNARAAAAPVKGDRVPIRPECFFPIAGLDFAERQMPA
jgi:hypothetical protein